MGPTCSASQPSRQRAARLRRSRVPLQQDAEQREQQLDSAEPEQTATPHTRVIELDGQLIEIEVGDEEMLAATELPAAPSSPRTTPAPFPTNQSNSWQQAESAEPELGGVHAAAEVQHTQPHSQTGGARSVRQSGAQSKALEVVEPDQVWEPSAGDDGLSMLDESSPLADLILEDGAHSATSEALLDILDSGDQVEQKILEHRDLIDEGMLELLGKRIELAVALQQDEAARGLQLLLRRWESAAHAFRFLFVCTSLRRDQEG